MSVIYKYPLQVTDTQKVALPIGARPLHVAFQAMGEDPRAQQLCLWALVDAGEPFEEEVTIDIFGTGHPVPNPYLGRYIGTVHQRLIPDTFPELVWHVFARLDSRDV